MNGFDQLQSDIQAVKKLLKTTRIRETSSVPEVKEPPKSTQRIPRVSKQQILARIKETEESFLELRTCLLYTDRIPKKYKTLLLKVCSLREKAEKRKLIELARQNGVSFQGPLWRIARECQ